MWRRSGHVYLTWEEHCFLCYFPEYVRFGNRTYSNRDSYGSSIDL